MHIDPGEFDTPATIQSPVPDTSLDGAGSGSWAEVATGLWISLRDALPSRSEKLGSGINIETRPARLRMRWRDGITADMRFVIEGRAPLQIISGPAMLGRRQWMEFMVEEYRPAGNHA